MEIRGGRLGDALDNQPRGRRGLLASPGLWLGLLLSAVCLWLAFRQVPFRALGETLSGATYGWLVPAIGLHLLAVWARAARWQALLDARGILADAFWAQGVGFLFTNAFPLRMGEPARVVTLAGRCRLPILRVATSAVVERALDVGTILGILALVLPWMHVPPLVLRASQTFAALLLVAVGLMAILLHMRERAEAVLRRLLGRLRLPADGLMQRWRELLEGLQALLHRGVALRGLGWSLAVWALYVGFYWCVLRGFRTDPTLVEAGFMVVALALAISVPSSPGFVGVYQLAGQQALSLPFGDRYDPGIALAITLVSHVAYFLLTSLLGAIGLARMGVTFGDLVGRIMNRRPGVTGRTLDAPAGPDSGGGSAPKGLA